MADQSKPVASTDRRTVLRATAIGAAVAGVGVTAAACSSNNGIAQGSAATTATAAATGPVNVPTSKVPVGGGYIDTAAQIVVTQPSAGEYKAFTAVCTHAQCIVGTVSDNVIQCFCHGSEYSAKDGSVVRGPATQGLAAETIKVSGSNITYEA